MYIMKKDELFMKTFISATRKIFIGNTKPHGHDFFELEYIIKGSGIYEIDGKSYPIKEGMLFFLTPADVHTIKSADMELINVMFTSGGEILPFDFGSATEFPTESRGLVYELLSELVRVCESDRSYSRLLLKCVFNKLAHTDVAREKANEPYISKTITYIMENFRKGISLEDAAENVGLSKSYLSDYFAKQTGINFKEYLDNLRFTYARTLLEFTDNAIDDAYQESGFKDYANFTRRFKKKYGCTPSEYRKKRRKS